MPHSTLNLPGTVTVVDELDHLFEDMANLLLKTAHEAVSERGEFHLALSGGSTPEPFYIRLVTDPHFRAIPWDKTHVWIVDERQVPLDHEQCNFKMITESLLDHVTIPARQIHPMLATEEDAANLYETELRGCLPQGQLDFVLLGMGDDAHTASLFPGSPALKVTDRWIAVNEGPAVTPPNRLTMTYPLLNNATLLVALVTGQKKAATLQTISQAMNTNEVDPNELPITGIDPDLFRGQLRWFLDAEAAGTA